MIERLPSLNKLIKNLQQVPYLASKNLYKVVSHFMDMDDAKLNKFVDQLVEAKQNIQRCKDCFFWQEKDSNCLICSNSKRNSSIICVVETWQDLLAIEKISSYAGVYHVLCGVICPLEGIGPENLTIDRLVERASSAEEIVLALSQTPEGEATASFISNKLKPTNVKLTCLAKGVPVGSSLQYMDRVTLHQALTNRQPF